MKYLIGVCLKNNTKVPEDGYIRLTDRRLVDKLCYLDGYKRKVEEYTPSEFLLHINEFEEGTFVKDDKDDEIYANTVDLTSKFDSLVRTGDTGVKAYRNTAGVVLFKKKDKLVFLTKMKNRYYFWRNNDYLLILDNTKTNLSSIITENDNKDGTTNIAKYQISPIIYEVLIGRDIQRCVYDTMCYFIYDLHFDYDMAQNFIISTFHVSSNKHSIKLKKLKLKGLLGFTSTGLSSKEAFKDGKRVTDRKAETKEIEMIEPSEYIDNLEAFKTATGRDYTNKELVDLLKTFKKDIQKNLDGKQYETGQDSKIKAIQKEAKTITEELNEQTFKEGNPDCVKCKGKGYVLIDFFGSKQKVKCECVNRYAAIKSSTKDEPFKNLIKSNGKALSLNMMTEGLIPRKRVGDLLDFKVMGDRVAALCKATGEIPQMDKYEEYKNAMRSVLSSLIADMDMDYSLLISAPNGFGKTTFVYSCLKLMLMNGKKTVPFVPLFELAQLRYDYMLNTTWRRSDNEFRTSTEDAIVGTGSYGERLTYHSKSYRKEQIEKWNLEEEEARELGEEKQKFVDMTDYEKEQYILKVRNKKYNYIDYLNADLLFCQLSVAEQAYMEISTLKAVLEYRGMHCKPTIILTDRDIEVYKTTLGMPTDIHFLNEMLTTDIRYATYDRAYIVAVNKVREKKLRPQPGVNT